MTTKRTPIHRAGRNRITPEVVAAYVATKEHADIYDSCIGGEPCRSADPSRHCEECRAHIEAHEQLDRLLGLRLWEASPLRVEPGDEERRPGTAWANSVPQVLELRAQLEAAITGEDLNGA